MINSVDKEALLGLIRRVSAEQRPVKNQSDGLPEADRTGAVTGGGDSLPALGRFVNIWA